METRLLRVSEVAELLSLSITHTYELVAEGVIPSIRLGKSIRVHREDLNAALERLRANPSDQRQKETR